MNKPQYQVVVRQSVEHNTVTLWESDIFPTLKAAKASLNGVQLSATDVIVIYRVRGDYMEPIYVDKFRLPYGWTGWKKV